MSRNKPYDIQTVVFHYNPYVTKWYCIPREEYINYFNGKKDKCGSSLRSADEAYKNLRDEKTT